MAVYNVVDGNEYTPSTLRKRAAIPVALKNISVVETNRTCGRRNVCL